MSLPTLLIINQVDFSSKIEAGSYNVCTKKVYKEFQDANFTTHKRFLRNRVEGKFKIFFRTMTQYTAFTSAIAAVESPSDGSVPITVYDTKANATKTINAFIDYTPTINLDGTMTEFIEPIDISIEER